SHGAGRSAGSLAPARSGAKSRRPDHPPRSTNPVGLGALDPEPSRSSIVERARNVARPVGPGGPDRRETGLQAPVAIGRTKVGPDEEPIDRPPVCCSDGRWRGPRSGAATSGEGSCVTVMMVRDVMTRRLVVIGPETPCDKARLIMDEYRVRHLPVMADGRLIGMVSDRDVRSAVRSAHDNVAS